MWTNAILYSLIVALTNELQSLSYSFTLYFYLLFEQKLHCNLNSKTINEEKLTIHFSWEQH